MYFGWAQLLDSDDGVYKMVMNIGKRPTFVKNNSPDSSVEAHVMHSYDHDFYGQTMKVVLLGYLRPEIPFSGLQELLNRINTDIGISKTQLDGEQWGVFARDAFLKRMHDVLDWPSSLGCTMALFPMGMPVVES